MIAETKTAPINTDSVPSSSEADDQVPTPPKSEKAPAEPLFSGYDLAPRVQDAVTKLGYTTPTRIQAMSIPPILEGVDVVGQAETGTGKTAAFALPLLSRIDLAKRQPQVLVMAPTRELAIQVAEAFESYGKFLPKLGIATIYGGQHYSIQVNQLKRGAQIVVGTPGRVMDHMRRGQLSLDSLSTMVLDEADEMLRMGFADDMDWVFGQAPVDRQTLLFSATLPEAVRNVAAKYLTDPKHIRAKSKTMTASTVTQRVCCVKYSEKTATLARILESEVTDGVIVFVKTRETSTRLSEALGQRGYRASALNGDMQQNQRERTVERLKSGQLDILVATDVAARGLDVDRITHVVNFDYPHDSEAYVHRIGRTGRAGREGHAILLVTPKEKYKLRMLEKFTRQSIAWMDRPTVASVQAARAEKLMAKVKKAMTKDLSVQKAFIGEFMKANPDAAIEDIAAAMAALATSHSDDDKSRRGDVEPRRDRKRERSFSDRVMGFRNDGSSRDSDRPRGKRGDRNRKEGAGGKRPAREYPNRDWTKYRIEVGYTHGVRPGNIVGAMTHESGLTGKDIGEIDIQTKYSTIDLAPDLTAEQIKGLQYLQVAGQALRISRWDRSERRGEKGNSGDGFSKPRRDKKKKSKLKKGGPKAAGKKKSKQKKQKPKPK